MAMYLSECVTPSTGTGQLEGLPHHLPASGHHLLTVTLGLQGLVPSFVHSPMAALRPGVGNPHVEGRNQPLSFPRKERAHTSRKRKIVTHEKEADISRVTAKLNQLPEL